MIKSNHLSIKLLLSTYICIRQISVPNRQYSCFVLYCIVLYLKNNVVVIHQATFWQESKHSHFIFCLKLNQQYANLHVHNNMYLLFFFQRTGSHLQPPMDRKINEMYKKVEHNVCIQIKYHVSPTHQDAVLNEEKTQIGWTCCLDNDSCILFIIIKE